MYLDPNIGLTAEQLESLTEEEFARVIEYCHVRRFQRNADERTQKELTWGPLPELPHRVLEMLATNDPGRFRRRLAVQNRKMQKSGLLWRIVDSLRVYGKL